MLRDPIYSKGHKELEELVDEGLATGRLARSRFLGWLGAGIFGAAVGAVLPSVAEASSTAVAPSTCGTTLYPCGGFPLCSGGCTGCCRNDISYCDPHCSGHYLGCESGTTCWYTCYNGRTHKCCDCQCTGCDPCICHFILGTC